MERQKGKLTKETLEKSLRGIEGGIELKTLKPRNQLVRNMDKSEVLLWKEKTGNR